VADKQRHHRLTADERAKIVELWLERVPVRDIAEKVGRNKNTVVNVTQQFREERRRELQDHLADLHTRHVAQVERNAQDARRAFGEAYEIGELGPAAAFLRQELAALERAAKLLGTDQPTKLEHSGVVQTNEASALEKLAETLNSMAEKTETDG